MCKSSAGPSTQRALSKRCVEVSPGVSAEDAAAQEHPGLRYADGSFVTAQPGTRMAGKRPKDEEAEVKEKLFIKNETQQNKT